MAKRFTLELCLGDNAVWAAKEYDVNIPEIAIKAILEHLAIKNELCNNLSGLSPTLENRALRALLKEALLELEITKQDLRAMVTRPEEKRSFIPLRAIRPVIQ